MRRIGFIGYGLRSETMLKAFRALEADICVAAVADPRHAQIAPGTKDNPYFAETRWYEDAAPLLARHDLDGVFIGTRCPLHTPLACRVLKTGMPLFLEKPVCISREQYEALREAGRGQEKRVVVSFPLRFSTITLEMEKLARSGSLGRLTMVQAVNNVPCGSVYYHSWYRDPAQTGGLFLQKATHDVDYLCFLTGERPVSVCAATAKLYYRGDRPAGLRCPDCPDYRTCRESSYVVGRILKEDVQGDACCFAKDTGNEDGAAMILTMESGMIVTYSQNFTVKKGAGRRGARPVSYTHLDVYKRQGMPKKMPPCPKQLESSSAPASAASVLPAPIGASRIKIPGAAQMCIRDRVYSLFLQPANLVLWCYVCMHCPAYSGVRGFNTCGWICCQTELPNAVPLDSFQ